MQVVLSSDRFGLKMQAKKEIIIVDIPSPGVLGGVFADLILALTHSLDKLGFRVVYERRLVRTTSPVIIFGMYREFIKKTPKIRLPENYFIFNLAPLLNEGVPWFDNYIDCLLENNSIDYSYVNIDFIGERRSAPKKTHLFEFGYFDLMPFRGFQRTDSYLFYGKINEGRMLRLKGFREAGVNIAILENIWGHERDIQIRTAKAIINIGKYNPSLLEVYRIWHSLCIGTPVYSDAGVDGGLVHCYAKYSNIVEHLNVEALALAPIAPEIYRRETSFIENTRALLDFIF